MNPLHQSLHDLAMQPGDSYAQRHTRDVARMKQLYLETAPQRWRAMIDAWLQDQDQHQGQGSSCAMWQMHAANYLARTGPLRWAIDPVRLAGVVRGSQDVDVSPLASLDLIFLTHNHVDHADKILWQRLADAPIQWVVPEFMREVFIEATGITDSRLIQPIPGRMISIGGLEILPFDGQHFEHRPAQGDQPARTLGVPAMGYDISWQSRRWLFPGDTRDYNPAALLSRRGAETVFGHVWLGRASAHLDQPPLLEKQVSFLAALEPVKRVVLAHLYEISRPPQDCWTADHARKIQAALNHRLPAVEVVWAHAGQAIPTE